MELSGDILIGAPRTKVWDGLNDAEILVRSIPGCEAMEVVSPTERTARVMVKVGPVRARFTGNMRMQDIRPGEGCTLHFEGSGGPAGIAKGQSTVSLTEEDGGTRLHYSVQASVGGKLGQVGGRMIDAAAKQLADEFFAAFNDALGAQEQVPAAAAEVVDSAVHAPNVLRPPVPPAPAPVGEGVRILWFALGALSTAFGVWIASLFSP